MCVVYHAYHQCAICFFFQLVPAYSLHNGNDTNSTYGWVHVTVNQTEGRLCSYFHSDIYYRVLCRQLGFIDGDEYHATLPQQEESLPFWMAHYDRCDGDSTNLETCRVGQFEKGEMTTASASSDRENYTVTTEPFCYQNAIKAFCYSKSGKVSAFSCMHVGCGCVRACVRTLYWYAAACIKVSFQKW